MCCPSTKVIESGTKVSSSRKVTGRQVMRHFTTNGTGQCQNGSSNLLTPYREHPRWARIVVAYPRPAFSATKWRNHAPISFDQQAWVSQGHTLCRNKENWNAEVHGGGVLELKPAREPAYSRPKPCASLEKPHESCPFAAPCWPLDQTVVRDQLFPQKPPGLRTGVQHSPGSSTIELPSPNLVRINPIERHHAFRNSAPCLSRAATSRRAPSWSSEEAHLVNTILNPPNLRCVWIYQLSRKDSQLAVSLEGEPGPTSAGKTQPHSYL